MVVHVDIFTRGKVVFVHVLKANGDVDLEVDCGIWPATTFLPEVGDPSCP